MTYHTKVFMRTLKNIKGSLFTGYITSENELADLYKNCFAYVHGHEFGGTNPTLINAISFNCKIMALDTVFNREMLRNGDFGVFFNKKKKSIRNVFNEIESNNNVTSISMSSRKKYIENNYNWDLISDQYVDLFNGHQV